MLSTTTSVHSSAPIHSSALKKGSSPEALYQSNLGLVGLCLKRFPSLTAEDREDAYTAGLWGLWKAVQNFDPGRGFQFGSYAVPCMSLETPIGDNGSEFADLIADEDAEQPGQALVENAGFEALLSLVPAKQASLLREIYGEGASPEEMSGSRGVSRQRVYQLHMAALEKLRKAVRQQEKGVRQAEAQNIRRLATRQSLGYEV